MDELTEKAGNGNLDPMELLVVEDNSSDVMIIQIAFERASTKTKVNIARDGIEALDFLYRRGNYLRNRGEKLPDFILMDIMMPGLNGFETLQTLKQDQNLRRIPVIMLTTSSNIQDINKSYELGAVSYIQKPDSYEDLVTLINTFISYWTHISKIPTKLSA